MIITASQCRAARALAEVTLDVLAERSDIDAIRIGQFEDKIIILDDDVAGQLQGALEELGVLFLDEGDAGIGVRLKFRQSDVDRLLTLENEGGETGLDEVP